MSNERSISNNQQNEEAYNLAMQYGPDWESSGAKDVFVDPQSVRLDGSDAGVIGSQDLLKEHGQSVVVDKTKSRDISVLTAVMRNAEQILGKLEGNGSGNPSKETTGLKARLVAATETLEEQSSTSVMPESTTDLSSPAYSDYQNGLHASLEGSGHGSSKQRKKALWSEQRNAAHSMRSIVICSNCRSRKVRCDAGTPCQACVKYYKDRLTDNPCVRSSKSKSPTRAPSSAKELSPSTYSVDVGSHFVSEPKAATLGTFDDPTSQPNFQEGNSFVVCDARGGKVDLTSYKVLETKPLNSLSKELILPDDADQGTRSVRKRKVPNEEEAVAPAPSRSSSLDDVHGADMVELEKNWETTIYQLKHARDRYLQPLPNVSLDLSYLGEQHFLNSESSHEPIYGALRSVVTDYPESLIQPELAMYRRFEVLNAHNLVYYQKELTGLRDSLAIDEPVEDMQHEIYCSDHYINLDETRSGPSSYAASVFSVASLASSASDLSKNSHYSSKQIATATRELFDIFMRDSELLKLYKRAISISEIGPDRLQRNLGRLFKTYARNLEDEYTESLEYLASKLVAIKSRSLAKAIVERHYCAPVEGRAEACEVQDESSEDEADSQPMDEKIFEDLKAFREFLTGAAAFETLRTQIRAFVVPKSQPVDLTEPAPSGESSSSRPTHMTTKSTTTTRTWQTWRVGIAEAIDMLLIDRNFGLVAKVASLLIFDAFALIIDRVYITVGVLEPLLSPGRVRLRWRCVSLVPQSDMPTKADRTRHVATDFSAM